MKRLGLLLAFFALLSLAGARAQGITLPGPGLPVTSGGGGGTPTFVNSATPNTPNGTTVTSLSIAYAPSVGNTVLVFGCGAGVLATDAITFTDDASPPNTYTTLLAAPSVNSGAAYGCNFGVGHIVNAPTHVIYNNSVSRTFVGVGAEQYSNVLTSASPVDGTPVANPQSGAGTVANAITSTSTTPTANGDLIWGFSVSIQSTGMLFGTVPAFTGHLANTNTFYTEALVQTTAAAIAATFTDSSAADFNITFAVALKHS